MKALKLSTLVQTKKRLDIQEFKRHITAAAKPLKKLQNLAAEGSRLLTINVHP
jgi:hypothetical protein